MPGCYLSQIARLPHCCSQPYTSPYARCRASLCTAVRLQLPRGARVPVRSAVRCPAASHGGYHCKREASTRRGRLPVGGPASELPQQPSTASSWDSHACWDAGLSPAGTLSRQSGTSLAQHDLSNLRNVLSKEQSASESDPILHAYLSPLQIKK